MVPIVVEFSVHLGPMYVQKDATAFQTVFYFVSSENLEIETEAFCDFQVAGKEEQLQNLRRHPSFKESI